MTFKNVSTYNELSLQELCSEMRIDVTQLLKEPIGSSQSYQIAGNVGEEGIAFANGEVTITRTNRGVLTKGTITANVKAICSRCLGPANYVVSFALEDEFYPRVDILNNSALSREPDYANIIDGNALDLTETIRQYTLLAMPAKPLCRPDCAGLCPSCGHDINQGLCQCSSPVYDQHWSKLVPLGKESEV